MRWILLGERQCGDVAILDLEGSMAICDIDTQLPACVARLMTEGRLKFVLNLEHVRHIDSSGLGGILRAYTEVVRSGGELALLHASTQVRSILKTTRLDNILRVFDSEAAALAGFGASASGADRR